jgi:hypothetical protein
MTAKQFIALADAFKYTRPYVAQEDSQSVDYARQLAQYKQWLLDIQTVAMQLSKAYPKFLPILWMDYIHGLVGPRGAKLLVNAKAKEVQMVKD